MSGDTFTGVIGILLFIAAAVVAVAWLVLPFWLASKLTEIREAVALASRQAVAASEREARLLAGIETATRQTAEACAALTQWQERAQEGKP